MKPGQAVEPGALCASFLMTLLQSPEQMGKDLHSSDLLCSQAHCPAELPQVPLCQPQKGIRWRKPRPEEHCCRALTLISPCSESWPKPRPRGRTACVWVSEDPDMI